MFIAKLVLNLKLCYDIFMERVLRLGINVVNYLLLQTSLLFILPQIKRVFADSTLTPVPTIPPCVQTDVGCIPTDAPGFVSSIYGIGLSLIGGLSLVFLIYGGYILMNSQGNPGKVKNGRSYIYYAIAGLVLAIFGFVFMQFIAVNILAIPGIGQ